MASHTLLMIFEEVPPCAPRRVQPLWRRLWEKVDVTGDIEDCWLFTGRLNEKGYGSIGAGRRGEGKRKAHAVAYESFFGPIPDGLEPDHLCRNPPCCNPFHLEPVTHQENNNRGESPSGINSRKELCIRDHPLEGDNLYINPRGERQCKKCNAIRAREYNARKRNASLLSK